MIDFEDYYVSEVAAAVLAQYPGAEVVSEYVPKPTRFPHIYIRETDNSFDTASIPITGGEGLARLAYTVDVHSNSQVGRKAECKAVMAIIDKVMQSHYFVRAFCNPFPNENDATVYRMVARYNKLQEKQMEV